MAHGKIICPDEELGYLLVQTSFLKQRINNAMLKPMGLTYMQFVILAGIYELNSQYNQVSQHMIVTQRRLDKAMVSSVLKKLVKRGWVVREPNPADSRSWLIKLTGIGERLAVAARSKAHSLNDTFFEEIDQEVLRKMLKKLLEKREIVW